MCNYFAVAAELYVYGSTYNGFGMGRKSDVDICMVFSDKVSIKVTTRVYSCNTYHTMFITQ